MGFGLPSWSDIRDAASTATAAVTSTASAAATQVRDLGTAAVQRTSALAQDGLDLGRRAVDAVRQVDVRDAAATVREAISSGTEAARNGVRDGVEWAGQLTGDLADAARAHVPGGDNIVSNAVRGAISTGENITRFQLGVAGGVAREAVGLVGTVGELGVTVTEMQISSEARVEYGQAIVEGVADAASATGSYLGEVAQDPSRIGSDLSGAAEAAGDWAGAQIDRYEQAFRDDRGFETIGMDVGTVATYVVPVGGGPARGAVTAAVREAGEGVARGATEAVARETAEAAASRAVGGAAQRTVESAGAELRDVTRGHLEQLRSAEGLSNKKIGPAVSTVMDIRTGAISRTHINAAGLPERLNPALAERLGAAEQLDYIKTRGAGTHSEVHAANELLNNGSRLKDLVVYTEQVGGQLAGGVKPPCPHCALLLEGATYAK
ncbi:hypothetical protein J2Y58_000538 [Sphingomonas sp. BE138]|uniref:YwqJ-related putative deaminase n=1 Tax=Sphingomonas sp. BE138 TaxID=2817845 RepID=UPI002865AFDF|nr:YwqJ-related putative deaminase [Sphingomonas sp. BE138]MDR6787200.1 hypothetical protein [Sphingomonas sp. BE138]